MKKEKGKNIVTQNDPWRHYGRQAHTIQTDKNIAKRPDNTSLRDPRGSRGNPKCTKPSPQL